jgi:hypothetical protein
MNAHARLRIRLLCGLLLLSAAACRGDSLGRIVPVKGKVTADGKSLNHGSVVFWPNKDKGNNSSVEAAAEIGEDGTYELYTKGQRGAPPGHYKVTVTASTKADSTAPLKATLLVQKKYTTRDTTPLLIEVVDSPPSGHYDLTVK